MTIHIENFNHWYDKYLNRWPLLLDDSLIHTHAFAWGFKENGLWVFKPKKVLESWQYANAIFFIRYGLPFALFIQIRWFGKPHIYPKWIPYFGGMYEKEYLQTGIGWKQTGRFAIHYRVQSDASSALGSHEGLPNNGQAQGFDYGAK